MPNTTETLHSDEFAAKIKEIWNDKKLISEISFWSGCELEQHVEIDDWKGFMSYGFTLGTLYAETKDQGPEAYIAKFEEFLRKEEADGLEEDRLNREEEENEKKKT